MVTKRKGLMNRDIEQGETELQRAYREGNQGKPKDLYYFDALVLALKYGVKFNEVAPDVAPFGVVSTGHPFNPPEELRDVFERAYARLTQHDDACGSQEEIVIRVKPDRAFYSDALFLAEMRKLVASAVEQ